MPDHHYCDYDWRAWNRRFAAKLAKVRAKGVVVIEGSTLWHKLQWSVR